MPSVINQWCTVGSCIRKRDIRVGERGLMIVQAVHRLEEVRPFFPPVYTAIS